ncbi:MAG: hypothetical protein L0Y57_08200, partial [Beijerinckiaceae bacterium]|nr:hypothetical protein [Beijerinckiaceae bacterium]
MDSFMPHFGSAAAPAARPAAVPGSREDWGPDPAWTKRAARLAVLSLLAFFGIALATWLVTGTVVPWDSKNHFYAMFR